MVAVFIINRDKTVKRVLLLSRKVGEERDYRNSDDSDEEEPENYYKILF